MEKLIPFLCDLEEIGRHYTLGHHGCGVRPGAITVHVTASVERWEVEFFEDGYVEIERFGSVGVLRTRTPTSRRCWQNFEQTRSRPLATFPHSGAAWCRLR
jgi:hypothetical protein